MNKDNWGIKRVCLGCNTRFYDFCKSPIVCPACNTVFDTEYLLKKKIKNPNKKDDIEIDEIDILDETLIEEDTDEDIEDIEEDEETISMDESKV